MKRTLWILFVLAACLAAQPGSRPALRAATAPAAGRALLEPPAGGSIEVRRARTGHLLVPVSLDGADAGWFLLDTGAGMSCVAREVAARLQLPEAGSVAARGAGGEQAAHLRRVRSLAMGPVRIESSVVVELELAAIGAAIGETLGGVIGHECFHAGIFEIDLMEPRVHVHDRDAFALPAVAAWHAFEFRGQRPHVRARLEDHPEGWLLVDLGANRALTLHAGTVKALDLLADRTTTAAKTGGVGGMHEARLGTMRRLALCGRTLEDVEAVFAEHDPKLGGGAGAVQGSVGVGALRGYRCVFDYRERRLALLPR